MATTAAVPITIKLFQFIRYSYQTTNIYLSQTNANYSHNVKPLLILFSFIQLSIASAAFLLFKAKSIGDLAYSYCTTLSLVCCTPFLIINALKKSNILNLIEKLEVFIEKSKLLMSGKFTKINVLLSIVSHIRIKQFNRKNHVHKNERKSRGNE